MSHPRVFARTLVRFVSATTAAWALSGSPVLAAGQTSVGVSVSVSQPGFYGRIDIGDQPQPELIYPQPIIIQQTPVAVYQRPIYMRVPPGHSRDWARYCGRYRACGQPVYFVREMAPAYRPGDHDRRDGGRYERDDRDHRSDHRHDKGHGRGHGHDKH